MQRIKRYGQISTSLSVLSNQKLKQILADGKPMHEGIGGKSALISINDTPVFVNTQRVKPCFLLFYHFLQYDSPRNNVIQNTRQFLQG